MDLVLLEILLDGVTKYLTGTRQTKYVVGSTQKQKPDYRDRIGQATGKTPANVEHEYWQLQKESGSNRMGQSIVRQVCKGLKKTQRSVQQKTERNPQENRESTQRTRENKRGSREVAGPILGPNETNEEDDEFQGIVRIIREMWLERNTDRHQPLQGQKRIARITEATRTVTELYSLQPLIMPEHMSKYFAMPLEEMLEQSAPNMLVWVTR